MRQNEFEISSALARAIVDTVREPFVVLDQDLRITAASRSLYTVFQIESGEAQSRILYELRDGECVRSVLDRDVQ
jgi:chemotaxis protein methyltransferase CheR